MSRDNQALDYAQAEADVIAYPGVAREMAYQSAPAEVENAEDQQEDGQAGAGSSGLIRAALVGIVVFVAVVGGISTFSGWFNSTPGNPAPAVANPVANSAPVQSEYQRLRTSWLSTRTMLDTEMAAKRRHLADAANLEQAIKRQESLVAEAETGLTAARRAATEAQETVAQRAAALSDLEVQSPQRAVETAQMAVDQATAEAKRAQADLKSAQAEETRVKATVAEMRKAVQAAEAAASAAEVVVVAADAAQAAVNSNQDVMADADAPVLSNLENDFFKEARTRAQAARKSSDAARQAVAVAEVRLDVLADQMADYRARFAEANQLEQEAHVALSRAREAADAHRRDVAKATASVKTANERMAATKERVEKAEAVRASRQTSLEALRTDYTKVTAQAEQSDKTIKMVSAEFHTTEVALKEAQRDHAQKAAVAVSAINANLNERLRVALGDQPMGVPVFDRFVVSSEQLFETGSAVLSDGGRTLLAAAVPVLQDVVATLPADVDWVLRVDGHTDAQPLSGSGRYKDNWELSQARALAVVKFLIASSDLKPNQLSANGFGEYQPLNRGTSERALAQNRRIELAVAAR